MQQFARRTITATVTAAVALALATAIGPYASAATPHGTPPDNSNSHLNIPISGDCGGVPVTVVAGDSDHATAQIVSGGDGHLLPVSFTFIFADGSQFTDLVAPHNTLPTIGCEMGGVGPTGSPVTVDLVAVWQATGH
jgi:hypothetical protein